MFATFTLRYSDSKEQFLALSPLYLHVQNGKQQEKIRLDDIAKVILEKRRKLAPIIVGGLITSLSLLSIFLYASSLELVALVGLGLLLTYFGLSEYVVVHLEHGSSTTLLWLPLRIKIEDIRPFIAVIEYYVSRGRFPIFYASAILPDDARLVHFEAHPVAAQGTIIYQFGKVNSERITQIAINPAFLDAPVAMSAQGKVIAEGNHLINHEAVIAEDAVSRT